MTSDDIRRRDLYYAVKNRGWDIQSANWVVDALCGRRDYSTGYGWQDHEDANGQPYQLWDRDANDD